MQLPEIIGHPGYERTPDGAPSRAYEYRLDETLMTAEIMPMDPKIDENLNYIEGEYNTAEYESYLSPHGITVDKYPLKICVNNISPITESFGNEFSPSSILSGIQDVVSGTLQEANFRMGDRWHSRLGSNAEEFLRNSQEAYKANPSAANKALLKAAQLESEYVGTGKFADFAHSANSHAAHKMDIPSIWRGNSQSISYELTIRLSCYNASNETAFQKYIYGPLLALKLFSCPRSDDKDNLARYKWPFLMEFKMPGLCELPLAYCSGLSVVKGGDMMDFQWTTHRPNMVDIRMSISPINNIQIASKKSTWGEIRPTIAGDADAMEAVANSPGYGPLNPFSPSKGKSPDPTKFNDKDNVVEPKGLQRFRKFDKTRITDMDRNKGAYSGKMAGGTTESMDQRVAPTMDPGAIDALMGGGGQTMIA